MALQDMYIINIQLEVAGGADADRSIDLDEEALAEVMRLSGARTKKDTVNLALREYAARHRIPPVGPDDR